MKSLAGERLDRVELRPDGFVRRIIREFGGPVALDCAAVAGRGPVRVGDPVMLP